MKTVFKVLERCVCLIRKYLLAKGKSLRQTPNSKVGTTYSFGFTWGQTVLSVLHMKEQNLHVQAVFPKESERTNLQNNFEGQAPIHGPTVEP